MTPPKKPAATFEIRIAVEESDIDELGHVNNVVYVKWVQDAAVAHWQHAADAADQESLLWVVTRHEIDYRRPAHLGDEIIARTWIGTAGRRDFERHTELIRAADNKTLAKARTLWCPINATTGRPTDVTEAVRERFSVSDSKD